VELLVSTVWLRPFDDESVTEEFELVELPAVTLVDSLVDTVVELVEFRTPLETTPRPTTISMAITTTATILAHANSRARLSTSQYVPSLSWRISASPRRWRSALSPPPH